MSVQTLTKGWEFKQTDEEQWMPVAQVPTNVHLDLMDNKKWVVCGQRIVAQLTGVPRIPDPFLGFNELKCEWVGEKSWTYRTTLPTAPAPKTGRKAVLAFDGLDTFAHVRLNGQTILKSDNMWIPYRVDITTTLKEGNENVLEIDFASALLEARKIKDAHPEHKWVGFNGDMARLAVRKAQYHW